MAAMCSVQCLVLSVEFVECQVMVLCSVQCLVLSVEFVECQVMVLCSVQCLASVELCPLSGDSFM